MICKNCDGRGVAHLVNPKMGIIEIMPCQSCNANGLNKESRNERMAKLSQRIKMLEKASGE